jgi:hypothetical protein
MIYFLLAVGVFTAGGATTGTILGGAGVGAGLGLYVDTGLATDGDADVLIAPV